LRDRVSVVAAFLLFLSTVGTGGAAGAATATQTVPPAVIQALCAGRPGCALVRQRGADRGAWVIDLVLPKQPQAEEPACNAREYWLVDTARERPALLAADCDKQPAADELAPAETTVKGGKFILRYVEFQSSDHCEMLQATVLLKTLGVFSQQRWEGESGPAGCVRKRRMTDLAPVGTATTGSPLLRLHVEWRDLHPTR
jgi:hypothetical protein